jgi:hypothetical protein
LRTRGDHDNTLPSALHISDTVELRFIHVSANSETVVRGKVTLDAADTFVGTSVVVLPGRQISLLLLSLYISLNKRCAAAESNAVFSNPDLRLLTQEAWEEDVAWYNPPAHRNIWEES